MNNTSEMDGTFGQTSTPRQSVSLVRCTHYDDAFLLPAVAQAFSLCGYAPARGSLVLVKPNLLRADPLSCTDARVVRVACLWLLERGVRVIVGDSPGFGTAGHVARSIGLTEALKDLPGNIAVQALDKAVPRMVPGLGLIPVSRRALEVDAILSVPRLKAHAMMRLTCAVKNLYGCVPGLHKAVGHAKYGDRGHGGLDLSRCIAGLTRLLPPQAALVDGITAMHITGPSGGSPYPTGLLAASPSAVAVDTLIYGLLGLYPEQVPLWQALQEARIPGAEHADLHLAGEAPESFDCNDFILPGRLAEQTFHPYALLRSITRRIRAAMRRG